MEGEGSDDSAPAHWLEVYHVAIGSHAPSLPSPRLPLVVAGSVGTLPATVGAVGVRSHRRSRRSPSRPSAQAAGRSRAPILADFEMVVAREVGGGPPSEYRPRLPRPYTPGGTPNKLPPLVASTAPYLGTPPSEALWTDALPPAA